MGHIVSIHSYRGGTGKSNTAANLAYLAAKRGQRVAVLDTDLQSPGVHVIFEFTKDQMVHSLTDFLFGKCELEDAAYDLTARLDLGDSGGALYLLPSSMTVEAIMRILSEGYDAGALNDHFSNLIEQLELDLLILDSHPGLNKETMLTTAISDTLILLIRPDNQDFHGTAVLVEVAGRLGVPHVYMMANKVVRKLDLEDVRKKIQAAFSFEVIGVLPLDDDMAALGSRGLFARQAPGHPVVQEWDRAIQRVLADFASDD